MCVLVGESQVVVVRELDCCDLFEVCDVVGGSFDVFVKYDCG